MITVTPDVFRLAQVFTISRGSRTEARVLTVRVTRGGVTGWGVTGGISLQGRSCAMGGKPGVVGWTPPAWWETGTQMAAAAGAGAFPPPTCVRVTIAARPAPRRPQK